jgi:hypothetical protein
MDSRLRGSDDFTDFLRVRQYSKFKIQARFTLLNSAHPEKGNLWVELSAVSYQPSAKPLF